MAFRQGGALNDIIDGTIFADTLLGLGGNDTLNGLAGNDRLDGGIGTDTIRFAGLFGSFTFTYVGAVGAGNNASTFRSSSAANGTDTILNAERIVFADNIIYNLKLGNNTPNTLIGTAASDLLLGFNGNDTLNGGAGNDLLNGDANDDTLNGGAGNDRLNGGLGTDTLRFAASIDTFTFTNTGAFTSSSAADGTDTILGAERAIFGASPAYTLKLGTNGNNNPIMGTVGNDLMLGFNGNDVLNGLTGNDYLNGGLGNDRLDGGVGSDTARFAGLFDTFAFRSVNPTTFTATSAADGMDTLLNMERVTFGNNIGYTLKLGTNAVNTINGVASNELLLGFNGNDMLNGGAGNDLIDGGIGNDKVDGGAGNDRILHNITQNIGAVDTIMGGLNTDTLVLQATHAQMNALVSQGVITAFNASNHAVPFSFAGRGLPFAMNLTITGVEALQIITPVNAAPTAVTFKSLAVNEYQAIDGFNGNGNVAKEFTISKANILNTVTDADDTSGHTLTITNVPAGLLLIGQTATTVTFKVTDPVAINILNEGASKDFIITASVKDIQGATLAGQNFTLKINGEHVINGTGGNDNFVPDPSVVGSGPLLSIYGGFDTNPVGITLALMGNETINGLVGNDRLYGDVRVNNGTLNQAGIDILNGGTGADRLFGDITTNNGTLIMAGNDTLNGGDDNDPLLIGDVSINNGTIQTAGIDTLNGDAGNDSLYGDVISNIGAIQTAGNDILNGGSENDKLFGDAEDNSGTLNQAGNDVLIGGVGFDSLVGDVFTGTRAVIGGNDELDGGADDDGAYYSGLLADFTFTYVGDVGTGPGNVDHDATTFQIIDTVKSTPSASNSREGTDTLTRIEYVAFDSNNFNSPYYHLVLGTNNGADNNRPGNLLLTSLLSGTVGENDLILGFNGGDFLVGDEPLVTTTIESTSDDALVGGGGDDALVGDVVYNAASVTQAGNDILLGGDGNDSLSGDIHLGFRATTGGNDELDGGANTDTAIYVGLLTDFTFTYVGDVGTGLGGVDHDATTFQITGVGEGTDTLTRVEQVKFDNNTTTTAPTYHLVLGTNGSNLLSILNGPPFLVGSIDVSDLILGFNGNDQMAGDADTNTNNDLLTVGDALFGGQDNDELYGDVFVNSGTNLRTGDDFLWGENGVDQLIGDVGTNNGSLAQAGNDNLWGGLGDDEFWGDVKTGTAAMVGGNDEIDGGGVAGGTDKIYYLGALANFTFTFMGDDDGAGHHDTTTFQIHDLTGHETNNTLNSNTPGFDTLTQIDQVKFNSDTLNAPIYNLVLGTNENNNSYSLPALIGATETANLILGFNGADLLVGNIGTNNGTTNTLGNDALVGGANDNSLVGDVYKNEGSIAQAGNDILLGGDDYDILVGDVYSGTRAVIGGNDELDGGGGDIDAAYYLGLLADFTFTYVGDVGTGPGGVDHDATTFQITGVGEGTDTLTRVEQVKFDNNTTTAPVYTLVLGTNGDDYGTGVLFGTTTTSDLILGFGGYNVLVGDEYRNASGTIINQAADDGLVNGDDGGELYGDSHYNNGTVNTAGNDILKTGNGGGILVGDLGDNNFILTTAGKDYLYGGNGVDILVGDVYLNASGATLTTAGKDYLYGGAGDDFLYGDVATNNGTLTNEGDDILFGGEGDDILYGGALTNVVIPHFGSDTFVFDFSINNGHDIIKDYFPVDDDDKLAFLNVTDVANTSGVVGTDGNIDIGDILALTSVTNVGGYAQLNLFSSATVQDNSTLVGTVSLERVGNGITFGGNEITSYLDDPTIDIIINQLPII